MVHSMARHAWQGLCAQQRMGTGAQAPTLTRGARVPAAHPHIKRSCLGGLQVGELHDAVAHARLKPWGQGGSTVLKEAGLVRRSARRSACLCGGARAAAAAVSGLGRPGCLGRAQPASYQRNCCFQPAPDTAAERRPSRRPRESEEGQCWPQPQAQPGAAGGQRRRPGTAPGAGGRRQRRAAACLLALDAHRWVADSSGRPDTTWRHAQKARSQVWSPSGPRPAALWEQMRPQAFPDCPCAARILGVPTVCLTATMNITTVRCNGFTLLWQCAAQPPLTGPPPPPLPLRWAPLPPPQCHAHPRSAA